MGNTGQPLVSFIMSVYNGELYIGEAIDGILSQTLQDFEIIIVDDGSTDQTVAIIESYMDTRILLLLNEGNRGPAFSRNKAIRSSQGKFLAILDADDVALPERIETQINFLRSHTDIDVAGSFAYEINGEGKRFKKLPMPQTADEVKCSMFFRCSVIHSTALFRKDFFIGNNLFYNVDYPCSQDYEMWSRAIFKGKIYNVPEYLVEYRCSPHQISTQKKEQQLFFAKGVYRSMFDHLEKAWGEKELELHFCFTGLAPSEGKFTVNEIVNWCESLHRANLKSEVFPKKAFDNEIRFRFLRFCSENSISAFNVIRYYLSLNFRLGALKLPVLKFWRRKAKILN